MMASETKLWTRTQTLTHSQSWRRGIRITRRVLLYAALIVGTLFFLFPLMWMLGTSLKTIQEVGQPQLNLLPEHPQWQNYEKLLREDAFYRSYFNSIYITTMVVVGTVTSVSLVAYSFSRLQWKGRGLVFALMMSTLMLPYQATLVPQYVIFNELKWVRTFNPITLPGFFAGGASLVFLMRQFMLGIPKELDEAAMIDGANPVQIWWYVIMPLCRPAIATVSIFLFVGNWNSLVQPLIYLQKGELFTMPIYVSQKFNVQTSPLPWQEIMAASVLFVVPVLVLFIFTQRYFIQSVTLTGTKG